MSKRARKQPPRFKDNAFEHASVNEESKDKEYGAVAVADLHAEQVYVWKTSKGKPYDVKLLRIHDKKPTGSGDFKEARLRQKEDSPSSSDDGSTARKKSQSCNSEKDVKPMDHFVTDDGIDLLSINAVDPSKYTLNLMSALFTDEELGSSCYKKRPESKSEKPPLSPSRIALSLLEG
eukprot:Em0004g442a